jgi:hypothetical protein
MYIFIYSAKQVTWTQDVIVNLFKLIKIPKNRIYSLILKISLRTTAK